MTIEKLRSYVPVSDEDIVDYQLGTVEEQLEAARRLTERDERIRAAWYALPIYVRAWRRLRWSLRR